MKFSIFIIFSLIILASAKLPDEEEDQIFQNYLVKFFNCVEKYCEFQFPISAFAQRDFKIRVQRFENLEARKKIFLRNYYTVEEHNALNSTFKLGINEFSHLTSDEFQKQKTGYIHRCLAQSYEIKPKFVGNINPNINWRNVPGVVQPVRNQGSCGSCWAFAALGALEGQMMLVNNRSQKLSEQEVLDCVPERGCNGGWDYHVWHHARNSEGVTSLAQNPYLGFTSGRACDLRNSRSLGSAVTTWRHASGNETDILRLLQDGPLFIVYHVSSDFHLYRSGIYQDPRNLCQGKRINHAVLLTGAGSENGQEYWIMKNSWGTRWGENGYFRMLRNKMVCGIDFYASYPVVQAI